MKQILLKILKVAVLIFLIVFLVALVFALVFYLQWKWWVGIFILIGLLGIGIGLYILRRVMLRGREKRFVQEVIEQDESSQKNLTDHDKEDLQELQARWKEAVTALRKSHLKKQGNPLYVLPWYIVIGESGSGKTTAIQSARLSSPFVEVTRTSGISGTRNCDWWFFEQAVIIDTAGRYAIPVDEGRDKDEWQKFLSLLAKFRKKEPLNGLVVTVPADKMASASPEELEEEGRSIRRRIDELMRALGVKFPVYVLVTKCDLIQGMTRFCDALSEETQAQAMGMINGDLTTDAEGFTARAIHSISERLRDIRLLLFHKSRSRANDPGLLLFPEEFERIKSGIDVFMKAAFQESSYQETPILRGLFFSSGKQEGSPYSHFLKDLGLIDEGEMLPGTSKGLFLHDFFSRIMPSDRSLFTPTRRTLEWSRLTQNLGLAAWFAVAVALCGLLSFSFAKNLKILRDASQEISKPVVLQEDLVADVVNMERFLNAILLLEKRNRDWWIPKFGLTASEDVENDLKAKYCERFKKGFLVKFDEHLSKTMTNFSATTPDRPMGEHVAHLVRRLNLLRARLEGDDLGRLESMPQPSYAGTLQPQGTGVIPEIDTKLSELYLYHVVFTGDTQLLNEELNFLQTWLKHVLTLKDSNLNWLVAWINTDPELFPVTLQDFWGGSLETVDEVRVDPAFTQKGKAAVDASVEEIERALFDPLIIAGRKADFQAWYHQAYFTAWNDFGTGFLNGVNTLKGKEEWQRAASAMGSDKDPYFVFLHRLFDEMKPFSKDPQLPPWMQRVYPFKVVEIEASKLKAGEGAKAGILRKATQKVKTGILKQESRLGVRAGEMLDIESRLVAAGALRDYKKALMEVALSSASRESAYQMAVNIYKEDPAAGQCPYFSGWRGFKQLRSAMSSPKPAEEETFWKLVEGPLDFLLSFVSREAACRLQKMWEADVLMEVQGVPDRTEMIQLLLGQGGYALKFLKGPAGPFIDRNLKKGFHPKEVLEKHIPFEKDFFTFLNKGVEVARPVKANYTVTLRGEPTSANKEAGVIPHATTLEMQCGHENLQLTNQNFPVRKRFNWSPKTCGDVTFKILVGNLALTKKYTGPMAFAHFLRDFKNGSRTFYPKEFPYEEGELAQLGIRFITAKYRFKGHRPVLDILRRGPGQVPREIVTCWGQ